MEGHTKEKKSAKKRGEKGGCLRRERTDQVSGTIFSRNSGKIVEGGKVPTTRRRRAFCRKGKITPEINLFLLIKRDCNKV